MDNLNEFINMQKESLNKLENLQKELNKDSVLKERDKLLEKSDKLIKEVEELKAELEKTSMEKNQLKSKVFDLHYEDMQGKFLKTFESLNMYKKEELFAYEKELVDIKNYFNNKINNGIKKIKENELKDVNEANFRLNQIHKEIDIIVQKKLEELRDLDESLSVEIGDAFKNFENRKVTKEDMEKEVEKFNFELKIGGRLTNTIGIFFIMLSLMYGSYTAYNFFGITINDTLKTVLMYLLGVGFLVSSEVFKDRVRRYFSLGLLGGGIGILYITTAIAYFVFSGVLTSTMTLILIILISVVAFLLAVRNDAKIVAIFALIGGYLPLIDFNITVSFVTSMAIYIVALNLFVLLISIKKSWKSVKYTSFTLNILTMIPFVFLVITREYWGLWGIMLYISSVYIINLLVAIYYPIKNNIKISTYEKFLLYVNTLWFSSISLLSFKLFVSENFLGFSVLILFVFFYCLAYFLEKFAKKEKELVGLFYFMAFLFTFIAVPVQLSGDMVFVVLVTEVTGLLCYGLHNEKKLFVYMGAIGLGFMSLVHIDVFLSLLNFFILIFAYISVLTVIYLKRGNSLITSKKDVGLRVYKSFVLINIYIYIVYFMSKVNYIYIYDGNIIYLKWLLSLLVYSVLNILLAKSKKIMDKYSLYLVNYCNFIFFFFMYFNSIDGGIVKLLINVVAILVYLYNVKIYLFSIIKKQDVAYTIFAFLSMLGINAIFSNSGIYFYDQYFSLMSISIALISIIIGFKSRLPILRKTMLGTIYIFIFKLFMLDMSFNTSIERVIAYFIFGVILILVSFVYQKFSKSIYSELDSSLFIDEGDE